MALNNSNSTCLGKINTFADLIKIEHTIFALPFAYIGAILAVKAIPTWSDLGWITLAMVGARSAAMGFNRVIDRHIDAKNPRTVNRHIPKGLIGIQEVLIMSVIAMLIFIVSVWQLSPSYVVYSPLVIAMLVGYSYTKRITWACHIFLGLTIGLAPLAAWIAVTDKIQLGGLMLWLIVALWIAGFDIIYATQDYEFDKTHGIHSLPSRFGIKTALLIARIMHGLVVLLLVGLWFALDLGWWYAAGVFFINLLLHYEHSIISVDDLTKVNIAFFNVNIMVSLGLFVFTLLDIFFS